MERALKFKFLITVMNVPAEEFQLNMFKIDGENQKLKEIKEFSLMIKNMKKVWNFHR
jgi:hypothetical protein